MKKSRGIQGFTLTELLVIVVIIGVLMAIIIPSYKGVFNRSHLGKCASNLRQIGVATQMYIAENNNTIYPDARLTPNGQATLVSDGLGRWISAINEVLSRPTSNSAADDIQGDVLDILVCPADKTRGGWVNLGGEKGITGDRQTAGIKAHSYLPNRLVLNRKVTEIVRPSRTILMTDYGWAQLGTRAIYPHSNPWMANFPTKWHGGNVNSLFIDGHVELLPIASLQAGKENGSLWYVDYPSSGLSYK